MRIYAHMVIGPGEAHRYLPQVLDRVSWWADAVFCGIDMKAGTEEHELAQRHATVAQVLDFTFEDHEGRFRQAAWWNMEEALSPDHGDLIVCIDADEVVVDHDVLRKAAKQYPGQRLGFTFHHMWSPTEYRTDLAWKPTIAWVAFPYRSGGVFTDRALASGREPTYTLSVPRVENPVSDMLHYGYARTNDQVAKHAKYMRLDGGAFHAKAHLQSIVATPTLVPWGKGGLLHVPE